MPLIIIIQLIQFEYLYPMVCPKFVLSIEVSFLPFSVDIQSVQIHLLPKSSPSLAPPPLLLFLQTWTCMKRKLREHDYTETSTLVYLFLLFFLSPMIFVCEKESILR